MIYIIVGLVTFFFIIGIISIIKQTGSIKLDSAKYFSDPKVASFVDHIQMGDVKSVQADLTAGINPNSPGFEGFKPIHFVFAAKEADVLKLLLEAGADPNARISSGNIPLIFSVRMENLEFTRALLAAGADPNTSGAYDKPPIHEVIDNFYPAQIGLLAGMGANINAVWGGGTPLASAFMVANWEAARILIDLGADFSWKDRLGETPLDLACETIKKVPPEFGNNKAGVKGVVDALKKRNITLPCANDVVRFQ